MTTEVIIVKFREVILELGYDIETLSTEQLEIVVNTYLLK